jgi:excisionase family DNA binding protein
VTHDKPFISTNKIASILGIHHDTATQLIETLKLEAVLVGHRRLFRSCDVLPLLKQLLGKV